MSGLVFVGTAVREQSIILPGPPDLPPLAGRRIRFSIEEMLVGIPRKSVLIETPASDASCGVGFEIGKQYLVYAWGLDEPYGASVCSRTAPLSAAKDDLALLREYRHLEVKSRLFGSVLGTIMPRPAQTSADLRHVPIPNVVVTASGKRRRQETTTDTEGRFVFVGLPRGVYTVSAHGPPSDPGVLSEQITLDNCGADTLFLFNLPRK
jgi:Carboxypeptidase regulatory-like domain